jgi:hypothetical protein
VGVEDRESLAGLVVAGEGVGGEPVGPGPAYRLIARWTGVDVLTTVRTEFGTAAPVNGQGDPLPRVPTFAPVLMITATKVTTLA